MSETFGTTDSDDASTICGESWVTLELEFASSVAIGPTRVAVCEGGKDRDALSTWSIGVKENDLGRPDKPPGISLPVFDRLFWAVCLSGIHSHVSC